jgi:hypothetical protein
MLVNDLNRVCVFLTPLSERGLGQAGTIRHVGYATSKCGAVPESINPNSLPSELSARSSLHGTSPLCQSE